MTSPATTVARARLRLVTGPDGLGHLPGCNTIDRDRRPERVCVSLLDVALTGDCRCRPALADLHRHATRLCDQPSGRLTLVARHCTHDRPVLDFAVRDGFIELVDAAEDAFAWHAPAVLAPRDPDVSHHCGAVAVVEEQAAFILLATGIYIPVADRIADHLAADVASVLCDEILVAGDHWQALCAVATMADQRGWDTDRRALFATLVEIAARPGETPRKKASGRPDLAAAVDAAYWVAVEAADELCGVDAVTALRTVTDGRRHDPADAWALALAVTS